MALFAEKCNRLRTLSQRRQRFLFLKNLFVHCPNEHLCSVVTSNKSSLLEPNRFKTNNKVILIHWLTSSYNTYNIVIILMSIFSDCVFGVRLTLWDISLRNYQWVATKLEMEREREGRQAPEWSGVKICSHKMMGWSFSSISGMKTSLGEWQTQGKLTPVIVSPLYEPLDSLAVSNFY